MEGELSSAEALRDCSGNRHMIVRAGTHIQSNGQARIYNQTGKYNRINRPARRREGCNLASSPAPAHVAFDARLRAWRHFLPCRAIGGATFRRTPRALLGPSLADVEGLHQVWDAELGTLVDQPLALAGLISQLLRESAFLCVHLPALLLQAHNLAFPLVDVTCLRHHPQNLLGAGLLLAAGVLAVGSGRAVGGGVRGDVVELVGGRAGHFGGTACAESGRGGRVDDSLAALR